MESRCEEAKREIRNIKVRRLLVLHGFRFLLCRRERERAAHEQLFFVFNEKFSMIFSDFRAFSEWFLYELHQFRRVAVDLRAIGNELSFLITEKYF